MRRAILVLSGLATRAIAIVLAVVVLLGVIGELRGRATDLSLWLVDVRDLPSFVAVPVLVLIGVAPLVWAVTGRPGRARGLVAAVALAALAALAARDALRYGQVVAEGAVHPSAPVSLSLLLAVLTAISAIVVVRDRGLPIASPVRGRIGVVLGAGLVAAAYPVAQIAFFGTTDYRRPGDAAVVFGARVYASGSPSPLLADRVVTGVELYRSGLAPVLVMSGGDGADGWNEADVMRELAIAAGVPPDAIVEDRTGINTDETVAHTIALLGRPSVPNASLRILSVSQPYHLPRIQLAFSQVGVDAITVPAADPVPIQDTPLLVAREIPAFWAYYLRICLG